MQEVIFSIGHHLEDMAMTAKKQMGLSMRYQFFGCCGISPRIASDVNESNARFFYRYRKRFGEAVPSFAIVYISIDGIERGNILQTLSKQKRTYVSTMENSLACSQIMRITLVPITVSIGENTYSRHDGLDKRIRPHTPSLSQKALRKRIVSTSGGYPLQRDFFLF